MVQIIITVFMVFSAMYYIDVIGKLRKDEKAGTKRYSGCSLYIPFAYWILPPDKKRKKKKSKSQKPKK